MPDSSRAQSFTTPLSNAAFLMKAVRNFVAEHRHTVGFLTRELSWGDTAVDLTAGDGVFAYWMSRQVGKDQGKVYAVESTRPKVAYLKNLVTTLKLPHVTVVDASAGAPADSDETPWQSGRKDATFTPRRQGREIRSSDAETARPAEPALPPSDEDLYRQILTRRVPHPIRLVRVDMSAGALARIEPAIDTLTADGAILLFTCDTRQQIDACGGLFTWLRRQGYRGGFRFQDRDFPLSMFHPDRHRTPTGRPLVRSFWFRHKHAEKKAG